MENLKPWEQEWTAEFEGSDEDQECQGIYDELDRKVVVTDCGYYPPRKPEALLIAAAPDLYRALEYLVRHHLPKEGIPGAWAATARVMGLKALAKARGETFKL